MRETTLGLFRKKGNFFHEGDAIAPNAPPQLPHWEIWRRLS